MTDTVTMSRELLERLERLTGALGIGWEDANATIRAALAAPAVEPVAWTWQHLGTQVTTDKGLADELARWGQKVFPLYPAPKHIADTSKMAMPVDSEGGHCD